MNHVSWTPRTRRRWQDDCWELKGNLLLLTHTVISRRALYIQFKSTLILADAVLETKVAVSRFKIKDPKPGRHSEAAWCHPPHGEGVPWRSAMRINEGLCGAASR